MKLHPKECCRPVISLHSLCCWLISPFSFVCSVTAGGDFSLTAAFVTDSPFSFFFFVWILAHAQCLKSSKTFPPVSWTEFWASLCLWLQLGLAAVTWNRMQQHKEPNDKSPSEKACHLFKLDQKHASPCKPFHVFFSSYFKIMPVFFGLNL